MMKSKFCIALVAAVSFAGLVFSAPSQADEPGVYGSLLVGGVFTEETEGTGATLSFKADIDVGFLLAASLGYNFGNNFRLEGEFSYAESGINDVNVANAGSTGVPVGGNAASGNLNVRSFLVNGAYDFDTESKFTPYVLGGFGIATVDTRDIVVSGVALSDSRDTVFAYQAGFGVNFELSDKILLGASYRYFATDTPTFNDSALQNYNSELHSHRIYGGVTYKF